MSVFRLNCAVPFWMSFKKMLEVRGIQITQEGLMFDISRNKYIEVEGDYDIFKLVGLKVIPEKFRLGGLIS